MGFGEGETNDDENGGCIYSCSEVTWGIAGQRHISRERERGLREIFD